jgi:phosphomannomutase / phosphoglucomutase
MNKEHLDKVFREYDIRGKVPEELDDEFFFHLGKAYVTLFKPKTVVVGHDIRPGSFTFKQSLIKGLLVSGTDVVDLGEIPTEMLYFAVGQYYQLYDGGLVITASHNPQGWNGCKMVTRYAKPIGADTGLNSLKDIIRQDAYKKVAETPGKLTDTYLYPAFRDKVMSFITAPTKIPLNIVVDTGNGMGGRIYDYIFEQLPVNISRMYFVANGLYPNHTPDPQKEENVMELQQRVITEGADFGVAIDGDADRVLFIDKKGRKIDGVYMGVLLARYLLKNSQNKKIIHDARITWPFIKEGAKLGATTIISVAGHSSFKQKMTDESALFGAEMSSHFFYKNFYNCDSGMVTMAIMLNMYYEGFDLTSAVDYLFDLYPNSGEVNYKVIDPDIKMEEIEAHYKKQNAYIEKVDGLSVESNDWRFNLRKSNTQPLLRLNLEATAKTIVIDKFREVEALINYPRDNVPTLPELR